MDVCKLYDCDKPIRYLGLCRSHHRSFKLYGDPYKRLKENHGMHKAPEYTVWISMKTRCYDKKGKRYSDYGGRGIKVCDRWRNSFIAFYKDMGERPSSEYSIERIDNDGDYSPDNCKWATPDEQYANRRLYRSNKSGISGVCWDKKTKNWRVLLRKKGKHFWGGRHDKLEDAILAVRKLKAYI